MRTLFENFRAGNCKTLIALAGPQPHPPMQIGRASTARRNIFPWASKWRAKTDGAAVAYALRAGGPVANVFGPVAFDAKGDANGMTYEMNVWGDAR